MITAKQAAEKMEALSKKLSAYDFRSTGVVSILHEDGSFQLLLNAFALKYGEWTFVFSEHCGNVLVGGDSTVRVLTQQFLPLRLASKYEPHPGGKRERNENLSSRR